MLKYARTVHNGDSNRLVDVTEIPDPLPEWAETPEAFIAQMYLGVEGFKQVPENAVSGSIDNGDGTYTTPDELIAIAAVRAADITRIAQHYKDANPGVENFDIMVAAALAVTDGIITQERVDEILGS